MSTRHPAAHRRSETDRVELTVAGLIVDLDELKETEPDSGIFDASVTIGTHVTGIDDNTK